MGNILENRLKIAQYIALVATAFSVLGIALGFARVGIWSTLLGIGFILGLVSYVLGGLGAALKMAAGIAKWGWLVTPFPIDIITFLFAVWVAICAFLFFPIFPVRKAYKASL